MSIVRSQEDGWTKEMQKWETRPVFINGTYVDPLKREQGGKRDHPYEEYPKMLFQAESVNGGPRICATVTVRDESEERLQVGRGWAPSQQAALDLIEVNQRELARLAANRAHNDRWMSGKAKEEAAAYDETHLEHVAEIPATPIKRRGRKPGPQPRKPQTAATGEG